MFYICVPVYNAEKYIHECIGSVLNQTYGNFKLILVDDGSPDKCGEICDEYAKQDNRIVVIHQKNMGQIAARQMANCKVLEMHPAKNAYVLYLDSDDTLKNYALDFIRMQVEKYSCDLLIYGIERTQGGKILENAFPGECAGAVESKKDLYHLVFENDYYNSMCCKAISCELITDREYESFFAVRRSEDLLQSIPYYRDSKNVVFVRERIYNYEINPDSVTQSLKYENYNVNSTVRAEVLKFLQEENVWDKADYDRYFQYCRKLLLGEIKKISDFDTTQENKKRLYDEITADPYYSFLLNETRSIGAILTALKKHQYRVVTHYFKARTVFGKIQSAVRKAVLRNKGRTV